MMQGFYWMFRMEELGGIPFAGKVTDCANSGISAVWLPPASKAQNGAYSMGYDPTDYYDFGKL